MWQKGCALLVGLVAVLGFGWVSAQEPSSGWNSGASYILKAGDYVNWPSGHPWYLRINSTSTYPLKVVTTNPSGRAIYAIAPATGYAVYANGRMAATSLKYTSARTHYLTIGSAAFDTTNDTASFAKAQGDSGGAWQTAPTGGYLVATVNLPDRAVVTGFRAYFDDNSTHILSASLYRESLNGNYGQMAMVSSSGAAGYMSKSTTSIDNPVVDNLHYAYEVDAFATDWDAPNLKIKGAVITYTINEAP
jgi:hypothetical protein